jgi:hypothetical protein
VNHLHAFGDFLAAATSRGIFLLEAGDSTWTDLSGDLPVADFSKVQSTPSHLWALAQGGAIWRLRRAGNVSADPDHALAFSLFPNPARDEARLLLPAGAASWTLLNPQGQAVAQGSLHGGQEARIPLAHLPAGLYHLRVRSGQQTGSRTLLIPARP